MLKTSVKLRGNLERDLTRFEDHIQGKVTLSGVAAMANVIYEEARDKAPESWRPHFFYGTHQKYGPFDPGNLREGIYRAYSPEKSTATIKTYRITWNHKKVPYGYMVEYGTSRAPATPFMRPAFEKVKDAIQAGKARMAERLHEVSGSEA